MLDTAGPAPLSVVVVVTRRCPLSLLFNTHARELFDVPAAVSTPFSVAARMVRCFGVWHGCVRVPGLPIAYPVATIVVRRQFKQHIVARIRIWRNLTGDGIGYDFEYTMFLASLRLTRATSTLSSRTSSTVSVHIIQCRRLRRSGFAVIVLFSGVDST